MAGSPQLWVTWAQEVVWRGRSRKEPDQKIFYVHKVLDCPLKASEKHSQAYRRKQPFRRILLSGIGRRKQRKKPGGDSSVTWWKQEGLNWSRGSSGPGNGTREWPRADVESESAAPRSCCTKRGAAHIAVSLRRGKSRPRPGMWPAIKSASTVSNKLTLLSSECTRAGKRKYFFASYWSVSLGLGRAIWSGECNCDQVLGTGGTLPFMVSEKSVSS